MQNSTMRLIRSKTFAIDFMYKSFLSATQDKTPMTEMELGHGAHKFEEHWGMAEAYITNSAGTQSSSLKRVG
jgi:hypothetical protein